MGPRVRFAMDLSVFLSQGLNFQSALHVFLKGFMIRFLRGNRFFKLPKGCGEGGITDHGYKFAMELSLFLKQGFNFQHASCLV